MPAFIFDGFALMFLLRVLEFARECNPALRTSGENDLKKYPAILLCRLVSDRTSETAAGYVMNETLKILKAGLF